MTGSERREAIVSRIENSEAPVSGTALAASFGVSRQVIVQDIALIRAAGYEILSTNRGYILNRSAVVSRTFKVRHTDEQLEEELYSIVDLGGCVKNVMVNHKVYGHMEAPLNITSRRKAAEFIADIRRGKSSPLKNITSGYHYHVIEADSEETLDLIADMLEKKGFLVKKDVRIRKGPDRQQEPARQGKLPARSSFCNGNEPKSGRLRSRLCLALH